MRHALLAFVTLSLLACGGSGSEPATEDPAAGGEQAPAETGDDIPPPSSRRTSPDGMCGGIGGFECPGNQWCDLDGDYPDASGTCRTEGSCDDLADCERQELVHAMCVGGWACEEGRCTWECS